MNLYVVTITLTAAFLFACCLRPHGFAKALVHIHDMAQCGEYSIYDEYFNLKKLAEMKGKSMKVHSVSAVRASISFPLDLYETLEELAKQKKVSLAWVVRDATERYVADQSRRVGKMKQG
jgi:hypothetical protein